MTDHIADAKSTSTLAWNQVNNDDQRALLYATLAAAEATIALAEEQRTANLFAYLNQVREDIREDPKPAAVAWLAEQAADIRERLGLER